MRCIAKYIKLTVSLITIILAVFILNGVILAYETLQGSIVPTKEISKKQQEEELIDIDEQIEESLANDNLEGKIWQIEIPKIDLVAPIAEGTSQEVMLDYVGHFENTSFWKGNIGLAAHNRRISNKLF